MRSKVAIVTDALGDMGLEIATDLARRGGTIVLVVRDFARGAAAAEAVRSTSGNPKVEVALADFASLASVRRCAGALLARHRKIHLLAHNAAVYSAERRTTADGAELMFGVNHLAPFLFTRLLVPSLEAARGARVVFNTGNWTNPIRFDDLGSEKSFTASDVFGMSKSANNLIALELASRLAANGICVNAVDPGYVKSTLVKNAPLPLRLFLAMVGQTRREGAKWPLRALTAPELEGQSGKFFVKATETPYPRVAQDAEARARLYRETERMVDIA